METIAVIAQVITLISLVGIIVLKVMWLRER
jgi:hypothetical protein